MLLVQIKNFWSQPVTNEKKKAKLGYVLNFDFRVPKETRLKEFFFLKNNFSFTLTLINIQILPCKEI